MTVAVICKEAGAETVVWKFVLVGTWRQTPESFGVDIATRMLCLLEESPMRVAEAETGVHAFGVSIEPEIVCTPFLKESRRVTDGTLVVATGSKNFSPTLRVCGTERTKATKITSAIIVAETQRRL